MKSWDWVVMISYLDFEHHVDFLLRRPRWRASNWRSCLPTSALAPPQVNQVRLLVPKEVHKQLVLQFWIGDPHSGPGQVAGVVEGGRFVDFLFCLVAAFLHFLLLLVSPFSLFFYFVRLHTREYLAFVNDEHLSRKVNVGLLGGGDGGEDGEDGQLLLLVAEHHHPRQTPPPESHHLHTISSFIPWTQISQ